MASSSYIEVRDLSVDFSGENGAPKAVDGVSFDLARGEILALVGESGSGKTVTSLSLMKLLPEAARWTGHISIDGVDIATKDRRSMEDIRGSKVGMIFQEPATSLNPVLTIARQMTEGLRRHKLLSATKAAAVARAALLDVGIADPDRIMAQFPHQLSGGIRQLVLIAAAIALQPDVLLADEPTTALDVTVQAQVLDLLVNLKSRMGVGILLVTHDIGVVAETADRVAVMRGGRILETGFVEDVLTAPQHDYTKALLASHLTLQQALAVRSAGNSRFPR